MTKKVEDDSNGLIFSIWFDEDMNDSVQAFAQQSKTSSVIAFADADRIVDFVKKNKDNYEVKKKTGETVTVYSKLDGRTLVIKPIKQGSIKDKELKTIVTEIDADDESISVMEVKSIPLKECVDIVHSILTRDSAVAEQLIESLVNEKIEDLIEAKYRIKVNAKGRRRRKIICAKGMKVSGNRCIRISAKEKMKRRLGMRKALRTKKGKGAALRKRMLFKRRRAMQKRGSMGL